MDTLTVVVIALAIAWLLTIAFTLILFSVDSRVIPDPEGESSTDPRIDDHA